MALLIFFLFHFFSGVTGAVSQFFSHNPCFTGVIHTRDAATVSTRLDRKFGTAAPSACALRPAAFVPARIPPSIRLIYGRWLTQPTLSAVMQQQQKRSVICLFPARGGTGKLTPLGRCQEPSGARTRAPDDLLMVMRIRRCQKADRARQIMPRSCDECVVTWTRGCFFCTLHLSGGIFARPSKMITAVCCVFLKGGWEGVVTCVYGIEPCLYFWLACGVFWWLFWSMGERWLAKETRVAAAADGFSEAVFIAECGSYVSRDFWTGCGWLSWGVLRIFFCFFPSGVAILSVLFCDGGFLRRTSPCFIGTIFHQA